MTIKILRIVNFYSLAQSLKFGLTLFLQDSVIALSRFFILHTAASERGTG